MRVLPPFAAVRLSVSALLLSLLLAMATALPAAAQIPGLPVAEEQQDAQTEESTEGEATAPLQQLLDVLRDDAAREQLVRELEQALEGAPAAEEEEQSTPALGAEDLRSIGARVADFTQAGIDGIRASAIALWQQLVEAPDIVTSFTTEDITFLGQMLLDLAALIVITYGGFFAMRALTDRLRNRLKLTIKHESWLAKIFAVVATFVIDLVNLAVPWAAGYLVAVTLLGQSGSISFSHSLYLNAFVTLEVLMSLLRTVLTPRRDEARLVRLDGPQARRVMHWSRAILALLVYGQLLVLPLTARTLSPEAGRAIGVLGLMLVLAVLASAVFKSHAFVKRPLLRLVGNRPGLRSIARYWHVPVLIYLFVLLVMVLTRPLGVLYQVLLLNLQIVAVVFIGIVVSNLLSAMVRRGITLPEGLKLRVPLLERRINAFIPQVLKAVRVVVVIAVVGFCLHMLGLMDAIEVLESEWGARLVWGAFTVSLILLVSFMLWLVLNSWVEYRINPDVGTVPSARERTLLALLRNAFTITLIVIVLMFVLSELGLNIAPLLASAGVIGLAIGFGAQKLVQDIITGVFIQLEGAIDVGDVVSIGGTSGVVERLTVRSAALRDLEGTYHIIPFSSVDTVTNFMRGFSYAVIDMGVAYREDIEVAKQAMFDAFAELREDPEHGPNITEDFEWLGLNSFGASEVVLRARIKVLPGKQWATKRAYNAIVKRVFDERGIEIPFPHQTLYFGEDREGNAPPLHIRRETPAAAKEKPAPQQETAKDPESTGDPDTKSDPPGSGTNMPDSDDGPDAER